MEVSTVIIDSGGYSTRAGFGGDMEPQCIIPTVVGKPKSGSNSNHKDFFVGSQVFTQPSALNLKCPIIDREVTHFEEMTALWAHVFSQELKINTSEHPVLLTESPQNSRSAREKTTQIMMETFKVPAFYCAYPEVLSLYSSSQTSGCVIDAGETVTHILPVFQSFGMTHVIGKIGIGGRVLNGHLKKLLVKDGITLPSSNEREVVRDIKEQLCYVALDSNQEQSKFDTQSLSKSFTLPDGNEIKIGNHAFMCPEAIFNPEIAGVQSPGLAHVIADVIKSCDDDLRGMMMENIVLTGGTTMFPGITERLEKELSILMPQKCSIIAAPNRKNSAWVGGSVMTSLATFSQMWISQAEYQEVGSVIVNLKCF